MERRRSHTGPVAWLFHRPSTLEKWLVPPALVVVIFAVYGLDVLGAVNLGHPPLWLAVVVGVAPSLLASAAARLVLRVRQPRRLPPPVDATSGIRRPTWADGDG